MSWAPHISHGMHHEEQVQQGSHQQKRPSLKSPEAWRQYWQAKGFPWRTEQEMDRERRKELAQQRAIHAGIKQGISLQRGEVEWYRRSMVPVGKGLRSEI